MNLEETLYRFNADLVRVIDGDTIVVLLDFGFEVYAERKLRLLNIDTPERSQPEYQAAIKFTKDKLTNKKLIIQTYKYDSFGRYLAEVFYKDNGEYYLLNESLQKAGLYKPNSKWNVFY